MGKQEWVLGYFSKVRSLIQASSCRLRSELRTAPNPPLQEKISYDDYNLACIVVFPPFRQRGWATLLIEFSESCNYLTLPASSLMPPLKPVLSCPCLPRLRTLAPLLGDSRHA